MRERVGVIPVDLAGDDIGAIGGQRDIESIGRRTHGEQKPAVEHELFNTSRHRQLHFADFFKTGFLSFELRPCDLFAIPVNKPERAIKLAELPGKIFMMQMHPVVFADLAVENLLVIEAFKRYLRVVQNKSDRVIPGFGVVWRIHRHFRSLFEQHLFHVFFFNQGVDLVDLRGGHQFNRDPNAACPFANLRQVFGQKRATTVV